MSLIPVRSSGPTPEEWAPHSTGQAGKAQKLCKKGRFEIAASVCMKAITSVREAIVDDGSMLSGLIRESYRNVAERFGLTPENCPKHPSNCTDKWIENDFARGVTYYILEHNDTPAGCVALEKTGPDLCYLERLAVMPARRRKGFGKILVDHVINRAKTLGIKQISIGIIAEQTDLKLWYQNFGFIEGATKDFKHLPFRVTFMMYEL